MLNVPVSIGEMVKHCQPKKFVSAAPIKVFFIKNK
jgi:hypothetical protein